ncbi:hypothetical protein X777_05872 [Ooceraea biroi]|uniref:Uncharacterized protein n=1 Tax=Ooceraea biroi TaxID=2015173 RepID=A0A026WDH5_OOCBI|nr:hypothetical protein X777_05872 [Ooceraea biroi]
MLSFDNNGSEYFSSLERNLILKLKTATRLKHNLGKILYELPIENYELHHSVKIIGDYLRNGGSLIDCLDVLPSITHVPIEEQIDSILGSMEDHLPKYLIPAISLIRRFIKEGVLDVEEIHRPTWGPPKSDLLEKISLMDLKKAASPLIYREPLKDLKGPWPKIIGETASLINYKIVSPRRELIAYMLANLKITKATTEIRESITNLFEYLLSNGDHQLTNLKTSSNPYQLISNAVSNLSLQNETLVAANLLLPFLKKPSECWESSEFINFFHDNILNYTLLISRDRLFSRSKAGIALSSMIQKNNLDAHNTIEQFHPFEYVSHKDLLLAFVSQLKRQQTHRNGVSDVVNSVYGDLLLTNAQKRRKVLRNRDITEVILMAMARIENSIRIQRLLANVASDKSVKPEVWQKAPAFGLSENDINGPIDATLKTLKALLFSDLVTSDVLKAKIAELINAYENRINEEQAKCNSRLETYWSNFTKAGKEIETKRRKIRDIDIEDLLQALPGLNIYTDEYISLKIFLSQSNLEEKIGQVDVNMHPTRGRLLAQLLKMMETASGIDDNLRHLAMRFIDNVAYEGYGAGALLQRFSEI